jgi:hypothetical protein
LRRFLIISAALALASCGDKGATSQAAAQHASDITKAQVAASGGMPGANVSLKDDAKGCKDKPKAVEMITASRAGDTSKVMKIWADGMKDQTCRGFAPGLPVKVDHKEGDLACILPGDDPENKQCFWIESKAL